MKIRNENTTITALIITVLIYIGFFTIVHTLTSKLSLLDQLKVFLKAPIESTIKNDIKIIMKASSEVKHFNCSELQTILKSKDSPIYHMPDICYIASTEDKDSVSYTIQRHPGLDVKDTYDVEISVVENSKKIDSIYSSLESLFIIPPKRVSDNYTHIDELQAKQPLIKNRKGGTYTNIDRISLINIKYSDLKAHN